MSLFTTHRTVSASHWTRRLRAWKAKRPDKVAMTYDQALAIVTEGLSRGTRRHRSVALGVAAQFEFTLRQIDVMGEWQRVNPIEGIPTGAIVAVLIRSFPSPGSDRPLI